MKRTGVLAKINKQRDQFGVGDLTVIVIFIVVFAVLGYAILAVSHANELVAYQPQHVSYIPKRHPPTSTNAESPASIKSSNGGTCYYGACYYYVGAAQYLDKGATGASVNFTQAQPVIGSGDFHSITELAVAPQSGYDYIEVGWTVDPMINGDNQPHLFVFHWIDNNPTCYNGCGFVATGQVTAGSPITPSGSGSFAIQLKGNKWQISYNGKQIGYFPTKLWTKPFKKVNVVQVFGEVAASTTGPPKTQMGNGILGSASGAASISNFALIGTKIPPSMGSNTYVVGNTNFYNSGNPTTSGFNYGGPGSP